MSCPEFEKFGMLHLSGELSKSLDESYRNHAQHCSVCRIELQKAGEILNVLRDMPLEKPGKSVRRAILKASKRKQSALLQKIGNRFAEWIPGGKITLGISMAAVTVIVIVMLFNPFDRIRSNKQIEDVLLDWHDDFISEMEWMDNEIERIDSGVLLASCTWEDDFTDQKENEDWLAPASKDLDWIRDKVEDVMKTIYGI